MKTNLYTGRIISGVAVLSAVLILLFGWRVWLNTKHVAAENALLRKAIDTPLTIRNLEIDILPYMTSLTPATALQQSHAEKVMLFARDTCPYCAKQIPVWKDLVNSSILDKDAEIWLISIGEANALDDMARFLTAKGRLYREFRVPAVEAFGLCTGIRAVPATIIARNNLVKLVYVGVFTPQIRDQIAGILAEPSAHARFPPVGPAQTIGQ